MFLLLLLLVFMSFTCTVTATSVSVTTTATAVVTTMLLLFLFLSVTVPATFDLFETTVYKLTNICPAHRQTNHQAFISQPISASHKQQIYSFLSFVFLLFSSLCKLAIILRSCIYFTAVITCSS